MKKLREKAGFTLVELIVVIAILGILTAIAVPTYSGYVKKANSAADATLLDAINTAFAAACIENGVDVYSVTNASIEITDGEWEVTAMVNDKVEESFEAYIGADKDKPFKAYEYVDYVQAVGMFVDRESNGKSLSVTVNGVTYTYVADPAKAKAFGDSAFIKNMGVEKTLGIIDQVSGFAQVVGDSGALGVVMADTSFMKSFVDYLGIDYEVTAETDPGEFYSKLNEQYNVSDEMASRAVILYAAEQSKGLSTDSVKNLLNGSSGAKVSDTILSTLGTDPAAAMAQTAASYSMYLAYLHTLEDTAENQAKIQYAQENPVNTLYQLDDPAFQNYIKNSSDQDIEGYLAAMSMLTEASKAGSSSGSTVSQEILNAGFNTEWMAGVMKDAVQ